MNNYLIIGIVISIVCIFVLNSDLLKLDLLNYEIRQKIKSKKRNRSSNSSVDYDSDSKSESFNNKKNIDDTEISFDDSSDKSKIFNNKNTNKKLLNNIKKFMINIKNKKSDNRDSRDSRDSRDNRDSRDSRDNRNSRDNRDSRKTNDIQEMHKLAQQLSKKNNESHKPELNQQSDNTNYDLTDTINGIINNELNNI